GGRAELVIQVSGAVEVSDRTLADPSRIVLDLAGATLSPQMGRAYDGVARAGVLNVRVSQFTPNVVRVVLDLERLVPYRVERDAEAIRVSFSAEQGFTAWNETVRATAAAPSPPAPSPVLGPAAASPVQATQVRRITVNWDRANIQEVIAGFQSISGRSIVLGKDITERTITANVIDQPWPEAFYAILGAQGLVVQEMPGGILRVDDPAKLAEIDSLEPAEIRVIRVNYAKAGELAKSVEGVLSKRGKAVPDTASNSIILTETKANIEEVQRFIIQLDLKPKMVSIQAKIIFVDRTDLEQLGFKYDIGSASQFYNSVVGRPDPATGGVQPYAPVRSIVDLGGNQIAAVGNAGSVITSPAIDLMFSTAIGGFSITSFLQALQQVELSDVQAEPTITTQDNKAALIRVGEDIPVRVIDLASAQAAAGTVARANVQFRETGIKLLVTPHVTDDGHISLTLQTERSSIQTLAAADLGFIISKQESSNQLLVADGETAVIGGLTVTTVEKSKTGIPLLSSLPLIGSLFSFSTTRENRKDLIILVTPRVVGS
ncbi:MAG TPA: AMIN domain-containing protein, partial [Gemmatimonadales bacterium]|nr:AMIN domain-containing protein [Gemmatimonadales bacterium]